MNEGSVPSNFWMKGDPDMNGALVITAVFLCTLFGAISFVGFNHKDED